MNESRNDWKLELSNPDGTLFTGNVSRLSKGYGPAVIEPPFYADNNKQYVLKDLTEGENLFTVNYRWPKPTILRGDFPDDLPATQVLSKPDDGKKMDLDVKAKLRQAGDQHFVDVVVTNNLDQPYTLTKFDAALIGTDRFGFRPDSYDVTGKIVPPRGQGELSLVINVD